MQPMTTRVSPTVPTLAEVACWSPAQVLELLREKARLHHQLDAMRLEFEALKQQLEWFRRQLFGAKSEKRHP